MVRRMHAYQQTAEQAATIMVMPFTHPGAKALTTIPARTPAQSMFTCQTLGPCAGAARSVDLPPAARVAP
jgi:hypothetical protein